MDLQILASKFYDYSSYFRGYSKDTIKRYRHTINYYSKKAGVTDIHQVTDANVRQMLFDGRTQLNWQANTFIAYHKSLAVFFRWCVSEGYMTGNPMDKIEVPKLEKRLPSRLTRQDAFRLLEIADNYPWPSKLHRFRNHAVFATFIYTGLRKRELLRLKCADVDVENMSIFVRQGKGSKDRIVPICHTLAHSLKRYADERKRLNKTCAEFFVCTNRNIGFTDTALKRMVAAVSKAAGIKFNVHKLRHTFATLMLEGGCDIYSLSRMMGHSDIKTTTIYLSATAEHLRSQITKHPLNGL